MIVVKASSGCESVSAPPSITSRVALALRALRAADARAGGVSTVTSWYRNATTNLRCGGAAASQHLSGTAFDVRNDANGARLAAAWRALGGRVLDERLSKNHWHLDLGV